MKLATNKFKDFYPCPIFPDETVEFTTRIQWFFVAAKKHITPVEPIIHVRFKCPVEKVTREELPFIRCQTTEVIQSYIRSLKFRDLLKETLLRLGGQAWLGYIERFVRAPIFSLRETQKTRITAPDGTIYIKSNARVGSPLYGKWHKIPPGFKNLSQAGERATIVKSPPENLIKPEEHTYCFYHAL